MQRFGCESVMQLFNWGSLEYTVLKCISREGFKTKIKSYDEKVNLSSSQVPAELYLNCYSLTLGVCFSFYFYEKFSRTPFFVIFYNCF